MPRACRSAVRDRPAHGSCPPPSSASVKAVSRPPARPGPTPARIEQHGKAVELRTVTVIHVTPNRCRLTVGPQLPSEHHGIRQVGADGPSVTCSHVPGGPQARRPPIRQLRSERTAVQEARSGRWRHRTCPRRARIPPLGRGRASPSPIPTSTAPHMRYGPVTCTPPKGESASSESGKSITPVSSRSRTIASIPGPPFGLRTRARA